MSFSWGDIDESQTRPNHLQVMKTTTLTNADCRNRLAATGREIFDHNVCTFTRVRLFTGNRMSLLKISSFLFRMVKEHVPETMAARLSVVKTFKLASILGARLPAVLVFLMVKKEYMNNSLMLKFLLYRLHTCRKL